MATDPTPAASRDFAARGTTRKVVDVVVAPAVLGAVAGAFLHVPVGYWIVSVVAAVLGFLVGAEHPTWTSGAVRGLGAGVMYGVGVVVVYLAIRHRVDVRVSPPPSVATPLVTGVIGAVLTAAGAVVLGRRVG
jgi:hypothetical protein